MMGDMRDPKDMPRRQQTATIQPSRAGVGCVTIFFVAWIGMLLAGSFGGDVSYWQALAVSWLVFFVLAATRPRRG